MGQRYLPISKRADKGATDCKNNLLGIMEALEFLLDRDFKPKRTIIAGFGFDEEIRHVWFILG